MSRKKGITAYRENPFIEAEMSITTRKKRVSVKGSKALLDMETGEIGDAVEVCQIVSVDDEKFVKIFTQNLRAFFELKPTTYKMVQVLLHQLQQVIGGDRIMLNLDICEEYFQSVGMKTISKAAFHRAVKELIEKEFLAESTTQNLYYINHNLFFNGDRYRFVTEVRKQKKRVVDERQTDLVDYLEGKENE